MKKYVLYAHGGSGNHGCEALVRTTTELLHTMTNAPVTVISTNPEEDKKYISGLPAEFVKKGQALSGLKRIAAKGVKSLTGSLRLYDGTEMKAIACDTKNSLCISIGGDNYCYNDFEYYGRMNSYLLQNGNKTVLWGCSVTPELLKNPNVINDLKRYSLITARESLTYNAMKEAGLTNTEYCPDSAFLLKPKQTDLPNIFCKNTVGINISPLIMSYENNGGITLKNYTRLIEYILNETNMNIALIPHVIWEHSNDLEPLSMLFNEYRQTGRVALIDSEKKLNACELKYIISKCSYMVTARTHASIAAYSTGVPTLVTGYSVKAKGIALDIFGSYAHYVCPVQNMQTEDALLNDFKFIVNNSNQIKRKETDYINNNSYFNLVLAKIAQLNNQ